jgi:hypothetical protein
MLPAVVLALALAAGGTSPSPLPCYQSLKFGGALYLDTDQESPNSEVGPAAGVTDPNAAHCGLPDRLTVYRHAGHQTAEEVVYREPNGGNEIFRAAGEAGFPLRNLRWVVLALVLGVVLLIAVPSILAHLRQPPEDAPDADAQDLTSGT